MIDWRVHLKIHPAAELFPLLPEAELQELAEDIRKNGLRAPIVAWSPKEGDSPVLLDGRNRLDALAQLGLLYATDGHLYLKSWTGTKWAELSGDRIRFQHLTDGNPYAIAVSLNAIRRHLTTEQKRKLIAKVLAAQPTLSDRQIGVIVKADGKTVGSVRSEMEDVRSIPHVEKRTDTKGRKQPAKKSKPVTPKKTAKPAEAEATADEKPSGASAEPSGTGAEPSERKGVSAKDTALCEFDGHVLRLLQMIRKARPGRFALRTSVSASDLRQLAGFLTEVASERPAGLMKTEHPARDMEPSP